MKRWPRKNRPANFEELVRPVVQAIRQIDGVKSIRWTGPPLPRRFAATSLPYNESLSLAQLCYSSESQGRSPLDVVVGIAVQLGIEQGHRMAEEGFERRLLLERAAAIRNLPTEDDG